MWQNLWNLHLVHLTFTGLWCFSLCRHTLIHWTNICAYVNAHSLTAYMHTFTRTHLQRWYEVDTLLNLKQLQGMEHNDPVIKKMHLLPFIGSLVTCFVMPQLGTACEKWNWQFTRQLIFMYIASYRWLASFYFDGAVANQWWLALCFFPHCVFVPIWMAEKQKITWPQSEGNNN